MENEVKNNKLENVKKFFRENKKLVIGIGVGAAVAAAGIIVYKTGACAALEELLPVAEGAVETAVEVA